MAELDLSKAVEAMRDIFVDRAAFIAVPPNADLSEEEILTAALPHLLDALASQAHCERVFAGSFPPVKEDAYIVAQWLRAKADEVRGA